ncbi:MAG: hypothetical protein AAFY73_14685, partial [Pseudomonadota bacterium]
VQVRLVEAAPVAGALRFDMVSEGKSGYGLERSRRTNQMKSKRGRQFSRPSARRGGPKRRRG